ncbi:MAG: hypothetical protein JRG91_18530, partial [Deltaproteobacteria bacterium]|nr:hypothetical protein [Deltaproteobacteria bacterium]
MPRKTASMIAACSLIACLTVLPATARGDQIKPYIMILLDTSSSMLLTPCGSGEGCFWETLGDGSQDPPLSGGWGSCCPGIDTGTGTPPTAWDTDFLANDSRMFIAKDVIQDVVNAYGDVTFGLMRYYAQECSAPYLCYGDSLFEVVFPMYMDNMNTGLGATFNPGANFG